MLLLIGAGVLSVIDRSVPLNLWLGVVLFVVVFITCCAMYYEVSAVWERGMPCFPLFLRFLLVSERHGSNSALVSQDQSDGPVQFMLPLNCTVARNGCCTARLQ